MRTGRICIYLVSSALSTVLATPVWAQESDADIIVTARRVEERLQDVPIAITVFNQDQLERRNVVNAADLANTTPSLTANAQFGGDNTSFSIRGFIQDIGTSPTVGVYFADVVMPRGGAISYPAGDGAGPGTFFDLQNVQVLNGPQGTLQGRNTTGGAVLIVPQKPTDRLEGYVQGTIGNYDQRGIQAVLNLPLAETFKIRLGVDRQKREGYLHNLSGIGPKDFNDLNYLAVRASIVADLTPDLENYTIASFSNSKTNGTVQKLIGASPFGSLFPFAFDQIERQQGMGFYDILQSVPDARNDTRQMQFINRTTWTASDTITIKNIVSYGEYRQHSNQALFGTQWNTTVPQLLTAIAIQSGQANAGLASSGMPLLPTLDQLGQAGLLNGLISSIGGNLATYGNKMNYAGIHTPPNMPSSHQSTFTEELQIQGRSFGGRMNWQAGAYFEDSKPLSLSGAQTATYTDCGDLGQAFVLTCTHPLGRATDSYLATAAQYLGFPYPVLVSPGGYNYQVSRNSMRSIGLYGQTSFNLTEKLTATAGFRYTWDKQSVATMMEFTGVDDVTYCPLNFALSPANDCAERQVQKSSAPTWLLNLDYKPVQDLLLYAKWARGYRTGGVKADAPAVVSRYEPEKLDSYEAGFKWSLRGPLKGILNAALFYNDFSNQQIMLGLSSLGNAAPTSTPYNIGKSRLWGVDVQASLNLFEGFRVDAAYAYLNTKVKSLADVPGCGTYFGYPVICLNGQQAYLAAVTSMVGEPIKQSPKNRYTITGTYTLPLSESIGQISVGATFTHTDKQRSTYSYVSFLEQGGTVFVNSSDGVTSMARDLGILPATNLLDLSLNWDRIGGSPVGISAYATNVTKDKYFSWVPGQVPLGLETASLGAPRMYGMRLRYEF